MNLWCESMPLSDPLMDFFVWLIKKIKQHIFEIYLFLRFVWYGVDDPRKDEMIVRRKLLGS